MSSKSKRKSRRKKTVRIGIYGVAQMLNLIHEAGHGDELNNILESCDCSVSMNRKTYEAIKRLVVMKEDILDHKFAKIMRDCDPTYEFCFGSEVSPAV